MSRDRDDSGRFVEQTSLTAVLEFLTEQAEPVTGSEVGDALGISNRSALDKLGELHDRGDVARKKVGGSAVVWWLTDTGQAAAEIDPEDPLFTGGALFASEDPIDETEIDDVLYGAVDG